MTLGLIAIGVLLPGSPEILFEFLFAFNVEPYFPGVGLGAYRGPPPPANREDVPAPPRERRPAGVDAAFCCLRTGDSGLGREGLDFGLKAGLVARPGPTD